MQTPTKRYKYIQRIQSNIPLGYAVVVAIGMLFEYQRYKMFGINIFEYADIFDFLIAPFKDFSIVGFVGITCIIAYLLYRFDKFLQRFPKVYYYSNFGLNKKTWYKGFSEFSFVLFFVAYLLICSKMLGENHRIRVEEQKEQIEIVYADDETIRGSLIGKTKEVMFLYANDKVVVIPSTSMIKEIRFISKNNEKKNTK